MGDEKQRVAALRDLLAGSVDHWSISGVPVTTSIGAVNLDDAAALDLAGPATVVVASDYVRGVKFALYEAGYLSYYDLGWYLAAANLSDIAAMGAQPVGLLTVVRYAPEATDEDYLDVMRGARDAAASVGAAILGGDSGGAERLFLSASAIGIAATGKVLRRSASRPGDAVCITGPVGAPAAALVNFTGGNPVQDSQADAALLEAWKRPQPRVAQGLLLSAFSHATVACQDVSDGLRSTVQEMAAASSTRFVIDEESIPVDPAVVSVADANGLNSLHLAMSASVDFELLFTVPRGDLEALELVFKESGHELFVIGEVIEGSGAGLRTTTGNVEDVPGVEWRHQSGDIVDILMNKPTEGR